MKKLLNAYVDAFNIITVLIDKSEDPGNKSFSILEDESITLTIIGIIDEPWHIKYILRFDREIELHKDYTIIDESHNICKLKSGSVVRCKEFDDKYYYDGPLGIQYYPDKTVFRIWTPIAKEIFITLISKRGKETTHALHYVDRGLWEVVVEGNLEGYKYIYNVRTNTQFDKVNDPYGFASCENGEYNFIINPEKLYKMKNPKPEFSGKHVDAVIYEASVRDFTVHLKNELQGTFLGMLDGTPTKSGIPTGLDYIKYLGITHLQLMPTFDFAGVDDVRKNAMYNWGYNPEQYFVPSGWYSKDPTDPYSRENELLMMIDEAHARGIRITMDVVFNHVYKWQEFPFDYLVPGYFYRVDYHGRLSDGSGCGNDLATERKMCRRFVIDVLRYYARIYKVSGFRFDLMGLLDVETLNIAKEELHNIDETIMLYGEGWNMANPLPDEFRPHMYNHQKVPAYGFFNDRYRDFVRGSQWNNKPGYAFNQEASLYDLFHLICGSCTDYYKFKSPHQTINYVECHDNYTFFDYGTSFLKKDETEVIDACKVALQLVLISQGVPFIHSGQEFFRTKMGIENSYKSSDVYNRIDYARRDKYKKNVTAIKDLIEIRKEYSAFRMNDPKEISEKIHLLEGLSNFHMVTVEIVDEEYKFYIIVKNDDTVRSITLTNTTMIFNSNAKCNNYGNIYSLKDPGVYILKENK